MRIDLGGGQAPARGFVNLDPVHGEGKWRREAQETPWPAPDGSCEVVRASHVLEHIPAGEPRILVFNEAWRVLRAGGRFEVIVPHFGTWQAHADPTHLSFWVPESFAYFDGTLPPGWAPQADYGIRPWSRLNLFVRDGWELNAHLLKVEP